MFGELVAFALQRQAKEAEDSAEDALRQKEQAEASQQALNLQNGYLAEADQATDTEQKLELWWIAQAVRLRTDTADLTRKMVTVQHYLTHDPVYVADAFDLDRTGGRIGRVEQRRRGRDHRCRHVATTADDRGTCEGRVLGLQPDRRPPDGRGVWSGRPVDLCVRSRGASPPVQLDTTGVGFVQNVRLSGSAGIVAGTATDSGGGALVVWDASTGQPIEAPPSNSPLMVAVSADGSTLASADVEGRLRAWRRTGTRGRTSPFPTGWPASTPAVHWRFPRTVEPLPIKTLVATRPIRHKCSS